MISRPYKLAYNSIVPNKCSDGSPLPKCPSDLRGYNIDYDKCTCVPRCPAGKYYVYWGTDSRQHCFDRAGYDREVKKYKAELKEIDRVSEECGKKGLAHTTDRNGKWICAEPDYDIDKPGFDWTTHPYFYPALAVVGIIVVAFVVGRALK